MTFPTFVLLALSVVAPLIQDGPTFRAGVDRVTVTAVVRRANGQIVTNLTRADFDVLDRGASRPILEFRNKSSPSTIALLVDLSGSMTIGAKLARARAVAGLLVTGLESGVDRVGIYTFDKQLHEAQPFELVPGRVLEQLDGLHPFGTTSLYDAVAATGRLLARDAGTRRAVVALTDGGENSSRLSATDVAHVASEIDVPVYVVTVADQAWPKDGPLGRLAYWTGGDVLPAVTDLQAAQTAQQIVEELRHQYFIGFAPAVGGTGWHPIEVRTAQKDLLVRARSGYMARQQSLTQHQAPSTKH